MDRTTGPLGERLAGAAGAATMVALLGAGLLWGLAAHRTAFAEPSTRLIDIHLAPPPPPRARVERLRPSRAAARPPAPRNLRNTATDIVAPTPVVPLAPPPPVIVAPKAGIGLAAQTGASDRPGAGEGAGGAGNGTGGGGEGDGEGYTAPRQLNDLRYSYLAPELRARGAQGDARVRFHVTAKGRVGTCRVEASSGDAELDAGICRAVQLHLRFKPSLDPDGRPVGADVIASHGWAIDRSGYDDDRR